MQILLLKHLLGVAMGLSAGKETERHEVNLTKTWLSLFQQNLSWFEGQGRTGEQGWVSSVD